jgi:hypothetical protein
MFEDEEKLFDCEYEDILSLWKIGPHYCGWYRYSGMRPITDCLAKKIIRWYERTKGGETHVQRQGEKST